MVPCRFIPLRAVVSLCSKSAQWVLRKDLNIKWILSLEDEIGVNCFKNLNFILSKDLKIAIKYEYLVFGFVWAWRSLCHLKRRRNCWGCDLDLRSVKLQGTADHKLSSIINHIERKAIACAARHTQWKMRNAYILVGNSEFDGGRHARMCRKEIEILSTIYCWIFHVFFQYLLFNQQSTLCKVKCTQYS